MPMPNDEVSSGCFALTRNRISNGRAGLEDVRGLARRVQEFDRVDLRFA